MAPNPLLQSLLHPDHNEGRETTTVPLQDESGSLLASHTDQSDCKPWRRCVWVMLATLSSIAVLYSITTTSFFPADQPSARELKRVTHAPSGGLSNSLNQELATNLHRTSFHFQPERNWMNDPNGPMYYKGYYHFFYQYNPQAAVWGEGIVWGHAVSSDLIHWLYLDIALAPDQWYDSRGVWSGSVTLRDDGIPVIIYTGSSDASEQTQNMATPSDASDPLLRKWEKHASNPVLRHPPGIDIRDFRDPTTAWKDEATGQWLMTVGAKKDRTGLALLYTSADLTHWQFHEGGVLHAVKGTGMWECVDFYPVAVRGRRGLQSYGTDPGVKFVLKASLDDDRHDYYAVGRYDEMRFHPDDAGRDCGLGLKYDHGKFYASKTFLDPSKERRVLWGWVNESDSEAADIAKGWSSVQAIPRMVFYDDRTSSLVQVPVEEVQQLRGAQVTNLDVKLAPGAIVGVHGANGGQLDIEVDFDFPNVANLTSDDRGVGDKFDCSEGGAAHRGLLGPFGLLVLADENLHEQTAVFFYVSYHSAERKWRTRFCSDQSRSSLLPDVDTTVYESFVEILPSEDFLSLRVLVDRSIVESFVQGGRTVITSRVYPAVATDQAAHVYLFNNATTPMNVRRIAAWQMHSVTMHAI